jgi:hypothetical protein
MHGLDDSKFLVTSFVFEDFSGCVLFVVFESRS